MGRLPYLYHSTEDPYHSSGYCYKKDKRASPGNLQIKWWSSGRPVRRYHQV